MDLRAASSASCWCSPLLVDFFGSVRIHEGIVEKARDEFRSQDAGRSAVDIRFRNLALLHLIQEQMIDLDVGKFDVHAGFQGQLGGFFAGAHNEMLGPQLPDAEIIRNHDSIKSPFLPQNVVEQKLVAMRRDAVDFVVGRHHALDGAFSVQPLRTVSGKIPE